MWLMGGCALFSHGSVSGGSETWTEVQRERSCLGGGSKGGSLCGLSAALGMTAGEENAAALQVTQDAGSIRVLTPLPHTSVREGECVVAAEFGAYFSSLLPREGVTLGPGCLQPSLHFCPNYQSPYGGPVLWELGPCAFRPTMSVLRVLGEPCLMSCTSTFVWVVKRCCVGTYHYLC